jgi:hypothetical protein
MEKKWKKVGKSVVVLVVTDIIITITTFIIIMAAAFPANEAVKKVNLMNPFRHQLDRHRRCHHEETFEGISVEAVVVVAVAAAVDLVEEIDQDKGIAFQECPLLEEEVVVLEEEEEEVQQTRFTRITCPHKATEIFEEVEAPVVVVLVHPIHVTCI